MGTSDQVCSGEFLPNSEYLVQVPDFYKTAPWGGSGLAYNLRIGCRIPELFPRVRAGNGVGAISPPFPQSQLCFVAQASTFHGHTEER
jgi:hypothetical protein